MAVSLSQVQEWISDGLDAGYKDIKAFLRKGKAGGAEKLFSDYLHAQMSHLDLRFERPVSEIGSRTYYTGRNSGRVDCIIPEMAAFEHKVVRLPRKISATTSGALYDIGQLVADYWRLSRAKKIDGGFIVVFLYGPLVEDADGAGQLYRAFHNQMHVDYVVAGRRWRGAMRQLGWATPTGSTRPPAHARAVKHAEIGAVCIDCMAAARRTK